MISRQRGGTYRRRSDRSLKKPDNSIMLFVILQKQRNNDGDRLCMNDNRWKQQTTQLLKSHNNRQPTTQLLKSHSKSVDETVNQFYLLDVSLVRAQLIGEFNYHHNIWHHAFHLRILIQSLGWIEGRTTPIRSTYNPTSGHKKRPPSAGYTEATLKAIKSSWTANEETSR